MQASPSQDGRRIPRGIWALGFVSLLMDVSSELIHSLLPVFLLVGLGTSALTIGLIEGVAESTALIVKVFSGTLSDYLGRRKTLAVIGYGLGALSKPLFAVATSAGMVFTARFVDRIGKGIRGAPRDALIADLTPCQARGAAYGLRQALDTLGAFVGPLLAILLMLLLDNDIKTVFWFAVIPAFLAMFLIIYGVNEPDRPAERREVRFPLHAKELRRLGWAYWWVVGIAMAFTLARFSEAFLILRAQSVGLAMALVPAVLVLMNVFYALAAYPAGVLSDNGDRTKMLIIGLTLLLTADLVLALSPGLIGVAVGVMLWGLHMGFSQGLLSALVADTAPPELRGTAFGMFNLVTGIALLAASIIAGAMWDALGPKATFLTGAAFTVLALVTLMLSRGRLSKYRAM